MAQAKTRVWQIAAGGAALALLGIWIVSGQLITGLVVLFLAMAMAGGALLYRFRGPPER